MRNSGEYDIINTKRNIKDNIDLKNNKKKLCIFIIGLSLLVVISTIAVLSTVILAQNQHKIFLLIEKLGINSKKIEIKTTQCEDYKAFTLEELQKDNRVIFNQSLMLINKEHRIDDSFVPEISEYKTTTVYMNNCIKEEYAKMSDYILNHYNNKLYVSSDFRTWEEQEALYKEDPLTATVPGASEHQTGLALDVYVALYSGDGFIKSKEGRYVNSHSWEYGFIIRYPSYGEDSTGIRFEPWHIRYVGRPHSDIIYNNHLTLEEYIESLELNKWYLAEGYTICRQRPAEDGTIILPINFNECLISPDNTGCYILTLK